MQSKINSYIQSVTASHPDIRFIDLPLIDYPIEEEDQNPLTFISVLTGKLKPHVKEAIETLSSSSLPSSSSSSTRVAALIVDLFVTTMIDVGVELGIPTYLYFTSCAAALGLLLYLPVLHVKIPCEYKDYKGSVEVPGMPPLPPVVMPTPLMDKKDDDYAWYVYHGRRFREADGLILNTFAELEPRALKAVIYLHHTVPFFSMSGEHFVDLQFCGKI